MFHLSYPKMFDLSETHLNFSHFVISLFESMKADKSSSAAVNTLQTVLRLLPSPTLILRFVWFEPKQSVQHKTFQRRRSCHESAAQFPTVSFHGW